MCPHGGSSRQSVIHRMTEREDLAQSSHCANAEGEGGYILLFAYGTVSVNLHLVLTIKYFLHRCLPRCCPPAAEPVDLHCVIGITDLEGEVDAMHSIYG